MRVSGALRQCLFRMIKSMTEETKDGRVVSEYRDRVEKVTRLRAAGIDPYPADAHRTHTVAQVARDFTALAEDEADVVLAGRLRSKRQHGNLTFADLQDASGTMQIALSKKEVGADAYKIFAKLIDRSDFVEVRGTLFTTKSGVRTLKVRAWRLLAKALRGLPTEHFGLADEEERLRKRYIDIALNPDVADMVRKKSRFWNVIRQYLLSKGFIEVETPVLENTTGGAEARPFVTHHNALDIDVYLRISAGELWQKRLMVAGLERTFEIGRIFRNEGISREHLQDYTQLEYYMAYADYREGMRMTQELYRLIAREVFGTQEFTINGHHVDFAREWATIDFCAVLRERFGIDPLDTDAAAVRAALETHGIAYEEEGFNIVRGTDALWKAVRKEIAGPAFLVGIPVAMEPLAKRSADNPRVVERFQVLIAGSEVGKGFSELNDPQDQRERFLEQQALRDGGDEEAQMADMAYVEALEYGMPPTFGFGVSERLFAFLMDKPVRETQIFPLLRPREATKRQ